MCVSVVSMSFALVNTDGFHRHFGGRPSTSGAKTEGGRGARWIEAVASWREFFTVIWCSLLFLMSTYWYELCL